MGKLVYITNEAESKSHGYTEAQLLDALRRLWGAENAALKRENERLFLACPKCDEAHPVVVLQYIRVI